MDEQLQEKFKAFEREIIQIQEQMQSIEKATIDLKRISLNLDEIDKSNGEEILAPIGKGIFAKAKLTSNELTVDVGEGNFVKKSIPETKKLIDEQTEKLDSAKKDLENELDKINEDITKAIESKSDSKKKI